MILELNSLPHINIDTNFFMLISGKSFKPISRVHNMILEFGWDFIYLNEHLVSNIFIHHNFFVDWKR